MLVVLITTTLQKKNNTRAEKCENSINSLPTSGI
jgi:hypothetical protein